MLNMLSVGDVLTRANRANRLVSLEYDFPMRLDVLDLMVRKQNPMLDT